MIKQGEEFRCYWKQVASSNSPEGEQVRKQNPQVDFKYCAEYCSGYNFYNMCKSFKSIKDSKLCEIVQEDGKG